MISEVVWMCALVLHGVCSLGSNVVSVSVKKGDSVTLQNDINVTKEHTIKWYFNSTRIAEIDFYNGKNCTDVQCNEGTERFRGRLKLDHRTGSLTIMNTRITDSGDYQLKIRTGDDNEKTFNVTVYGDTTTTDRNEIENITDSGLSVGAKAGIGVGVLLLGVAVAVWLCNKYKDRIRNCITRREANRNNNEQGNGEEEIPMQPMQ